MTDPTILRLSNKLIKKKEIVPTTEHTYETVKKDELVEKKGKKTPWLNQSRLREGILLREILGPPRSRSLFKRK